MPPLIAHHAICLWEGYLAGFVLNSTGTNLLSCPQSISVPVGRLYLRTAGFGFDLKTWTIRINLYPLLYFPISIPNCRQSLFIDLVRSFLWISLTAISNSLLDLFSVSRSYRKTTPRNDTLYWTIDWLDPISYQSFTLPCYFSYCEPHLAPRHFASTVS